MSGKKIQIIDNLLEIDLSTATSGQMQDALLKIIEAMRSK